MLVYPDKYLNNVTIDLLKKNNINALILDVDNTLINFDKELLEGSSVWCENLKKEGIKFYILSNTNKEEKVQKVSNELNIPYINFAKKPLRGNFIKVQKIFGINNPKEIAVVGDQIFTDVLGARFSNMYSILTKPIDKRDIFMTKIKRPLENLIVKRYLKKNGGK